MNKAIITTLIGGAIVGGGMIYSQSRAENETHSIITLQGMNTSGVEQSLTFDHNSCNYSDSTGTVIDGQATSALVEESCAFSNDSSLTEAQFNCALELCKNTP